MTTLIVLLLSIGLAPLAVGTARLGPTRGGASPRADVGSVLLCALAFNLTFIWQELWLVIPKALTPGLHPILYHNDHAWAGQAPGVELLQGTGALATLCSGLGFGAVLVVVRAPSATWRCFFFWMAFQGLFQSLTQVAIGTVAPGNDVGRALAYLHVGAASKRVLLVVDGAAMGAAGAWLARAGPPTGGPRGIAPTRAFARDMLVTAALATVLTVPFRLPRDMVEVVLVPLMVNLVGVGWLVLGVTLTAQPAASEEVGRVGPVGPALALAVTLLVFQLVLRPGIPF
jgi:hypothetical protein